MADAAYVIFLGAIVAGFAAVPVVDLVTWLVTPLAGG